MQRSNFAKASFLSGNGDRLRQHTFSTVIGGALCALSLALISGCASGFSAQAKAKGAPIVERSEPPPSAIPANKVYIRGSEDSMQRGWFGFYSADVSSGLRSDRNRSPRYVELPAGSVALDVRIDAWYFRDARLDPLIAYLAGGRAYVLRGEIKSVSALIWIEDAATGERVTDIISVATVYRGGGAIEVRPP